MERQKRSRDEDGGRGGRGLRGGRGGDRGRGGSRGRGGDRGRGRGRGGDRAPFRAGRGRGAGDAVAPRTFDTGGATEKPQGEEPTEGRSIPAFVKKETTSTFGRGHLAPKKGKTLVIVLAKAGLVLGTRGLVDAYEKAASTEIANDSLLEVRPDIVHQCLLSIFDSNMSYYGNVKVFIETVKGKTIMINPKLRPPRTFQRFKGLMETLFRDGKIVAEDGEVLLSFMRGTVAPVVPHGAEVVALCNESAAPVVRPQQFAQNMLDDPVSDKLQGGIKDCYGFVVVSCQENGNLAGIPLVSDSVCLSPYPMSPHVMLSRMCEGFESLLALGN